MVYQGSHRSTGCQFTFTCDGSLGQRPRGRAWERAQRVATAVMLGYTRPMTQQRHALSHPRRQPGVVVGPGRDHHTSAATSSTASRTGSERAVYQEALARRRGSAGPRLAVEPEVLIPELEMTPAPAAEIAAPQPTPAEAAPQPEAEALAEDEVAT